MKFDISGKNLTTLEGINFPDGITGLNCSRNSLTSLQYCPNSVTYLYCYDNLLTNLEYCPNSLTRLCCPNNSIISLEYCPDSVTYLNCSNNSLTSLEYCPNSVTELYCSNNSLTSLEYCPSSVTYLYYDNNPLSPEYLNKTIQQVHKINTVKSYKLGIFKLNSVMSCVKIQRLWKKYWYDELDINGINRYCKFALNQGQRDSIVI